MSPAVREKKWPALVSPSLGGQKPIKGITKLSQGPESQALLGGILTCTSLAYPLTSTAHPVGGRLHVTYGESKTQLLLQVLPQAPRPAAQPALSHPQAPTPSPYLSHL